MFHQVFVVILLLTRREDRKDHSIAMATFFAANMTTSLPVLLSYFWPLFPSIAIGNVSFPFLMLLGPALFFYARALVSPDVLRLSWRDAVHLVPVLGSIPAVAALIALMGDGVEADAAGSARITAIIGLSIGLLVLFIGPTSLYLVRIIGILTRYRRTKFDYFASLEGRNLTWFEWMIGLLTVIWSVNVIILVDDNFIGALRMSNAWHTVIEASWVYILSFMALWQPAIFTASHGPAAAVDAAEIPSEPAPVRTEKYSRSALDEERTRRIVSKVERAMAEDRLYRSQSVTLRHLSDHTRMPENYLSQVLNTEIGRSFYEFINHWRIKDACALLAEGDQAVVEIGEEVGFNSRSTFYAAFKKEMGLTPSDYRNRHRQRGT